MHGLMDSSNGFIVLAEDSLGTWYIYSAIFKTWIIISTCTTKYSWSILFWIFIAYLLADAGYDVWLANARGTEPSRSHVRLNPNGFRQKKYWSFSWHEIGIYDIPAIVDHMLSKTNQKKLTYIGFSQGTTSFLAFASMRPEYNDKLLDVHLLAPVSSLKNTRKTLYITLARFYTPLKRILEIFRLYKVTLNAKVLSLLSKIVKILCENDDNPTNMCEFTIDAILGPSHINAVS